MSVIRNSGVSAAKGDLNILKSMEVQSGHSELSVISQVSAVEGCPLSGVPLYLSICPSYRALDLRIYNMITICPDLSHKDSNMTKTIFV